MTKLISAGLMRLRKSRVFWLVFAGVLAISLGAVLLKYKDLRQGVQLYMGLDELIYNLFPLIGLYAGVLIGLLMGCEYGDGTVRNKFIVGYSRLSVFVSNLIVSMLAMMFITALSIALMLAVGLPLLGGFTIGLGEALWYILCILLFTAGNAALAATVAACCGSKASSAVLCIVVALVVLFSSSAVSGILYEPEIMEEYVLVNENGVPLQVEEKPNPKYVSGNARIVLEAVYDTLPTGQAIQFAGLEIERAERLPLMSLLFIGLVSGIGYCIFKKKDIK